MAVTMDATMDAPVTLPTADDFKRARSALSEAVKQLGDLRWRVWYLADWNEEGLVEGQEGEGRRSPGDEVPTLEQIGLIYSESKTLETYTNEAAEYVTELGSLLEDLDMVREHPPELAAHNREAPDA